MSKKVNYAKQPPTACSKLAIFSSLNTQPADQRQLLIPNWQSFLLQLAEHPTNHHQRSLESSHDDYQSATTRADG